MMTDLQKRIKNVKKKVKNAALQVNRNPDNIKILPVSKNQSPPKIRVFYEQGFRFFGENRVQEVREKNEVLGDLELEWHFIGHLQRNKVKYILRMENCQMIESVDSQRLAREINKRALKNRRVMPILVEVNVSGQESKFGIKPEKTLNFIKKTSPLEGIKVKGLMTLAPYSEDPEEARPYFKKLVQLKKQVNNAGFALSELSMGMTNDYQVAIEEGATIVRVGTAIFGE